MTHSLRWSLGACAALALAACKSSSNEQPLPSPHPPGGEVASDAASRLSNEPASSAPARSPSAGAPAAPREPVAITPGTRRALPANLRPRVTVVTPVNNRAVRENRAEVRLTVRDWEAVPGAEGRHHLHLALDDQPTVDVSPPASGTTWRWMLQNLAEGTHVVRVFPAWHDHEAVTSEGSLATVVFHVGRAPDAGAPDLAAPALVVSSPSGELRGADAARPVLDFHLANVPPGAFGPEGFRVRAALDGGAPQELTAWAPHAIEHLADGAHTLSLELVGRDGQPVPGARVERRFTVVR